MKQKIIQVESLTGGYDGSVVLRDVDMDVFRGEVLVIVGRSGCEIHVILQD